MLAGRNRDSGFKNGLIDDLQIFDIALTAAEATQLFGGADRPVGQGSPPRAPAIENALPYFLTRHHEPYRIALVELKKLREQENALVNDVPEIMVMEDMPQRRVTHLLKRGAYDAPGEVVNAARRAKAGNEPDADRARSGF